MRSEATARSKPAAGLAALVAVAACAASPEMPDQDLARAETAIGQAEQAGAGQYGPDALDAAQGKLALARSAIAEDEMAAAQRYAEEAALAAELAAAKARTGKAERAVDELEESIAVLREEIARNQRSEGETG